MSFHVLVGVKKYDIEPKVVFLTLTVDQWNQDICFQIEKLQILSPLGFEKIALGGPSHLVINNK